MFFMVVFIVRFDFLDLLPELQEVMVTSHMDEVTRAMFALTNKKHFAAYGIDSCVLASFQMKKPHDLAMELCAEKKYWDLLIYMEEDLNFKPPLESTPFLWEVLSSGRLDLIKRYNIDLKNFLVGDNCTVEMLDYARVKWRAPMVRQLQNLLATKQIALALEVLASSSNKSVKNVERLSFYSTMLDVEQAQKYLKKSDSLTKEEFIQICEGLRFVSEEDYATPKCEAFVDWMATFEIRPDRDDGLCDSLKTFAESSTGPILVKLLNLFDITEEFAYSLSSVVVTAIANGRWETLDLVWANFGAHILRDDAIHELLRFDLRGKVDPVGDRFESEKKKLRDLNARMVRGLQFLMKKFHMVSLKEIVDLTGILEEDVPHILSSEFFELEVNLYSFVDLESLKFYLSLGLGLDSLFDIHGNLFLSEIYHYLIDVHPMKCLQRRFDFFTAITNHADILLLQHAATKLGGPIENRVLTNFLSFVIPGPLGDFLGSFGRGRTVDFLWNAKKIIAYAKALIDLGCKWEIFADDILGCSANWFHEQLLALREQALDDSRPQLKRKK